MGQKIYTDINLNNNKLQKAKVEILDRDTITDDAVIDKEYVDTGDTFATSNSDINTGLNAGKALVSVGGIDREVTIVDEKTNNELWDLMLYPRISPTYTEPNLSLIATFSDPTTDRPITGNIEIGRSVTVHLLAVSDLNNSPGVFGSNPYSWSGTGINGVQQTSSNVYELTINFASINTWSVSVVYQGANTQNNNQGEPDNTNIFGNVTKTATVVKSGIWAYWRNVFNDRLIIPKTSSELRALEGKVVEDFPDTLDLNVSGDGITKSIFIAIPSTTKDVFINKDLSLPISSEAIEINTIMVDSLNSSGTQIEYTLILHNNGIGYNNNSKHRILIEDKNI